jgi:transcription elongation factor Elf1
MLSYDKRSCLERAQHLLAKRDADSLRYACLELRLCIEAITYEKLNIYAEYVPAIIFKKWQPRHALKMLLQFEPDADEDFSFSMSPESELGKPTCNWINFGEYRTFKLNWLNKNYNRLGNYLHMQQNTISMIEDEEKIIKLKNEIQEIVSVLNNIINSDLVAPTIDIRVQFQCQTCGHMTVANETVLLKTNHAICINPQCGAEYHANKENTEKWSFKMIGVSFKCLKCATANWIESRILNIGTTFKCRNCGEAHQIIAGQWQYEQKSKLAT